MMTSSLHPGDHVVTTFGDPDLAEGSIGIVQAVHDDPFDGVDVMFSSGVFNVVATALQKGTYRT
ncbi:hypothetical protein AB0A60_19365 [Streptomyces sp. NPDC046275]|uniref:hypothetical protein n=1 Tax=Streptomyces sp. NPDC046275 TaxID=3157201 RepID=UPI0033DE7E25